jgi:hypothetical protein
MVLQYFKWSDEKKRRNRFTAKKEIVPFGGQCVNSFSAVTYIMPQYAVMATACMFLR